MNHTEGYSTDRTTPRDGHMAMSEGAAPVDDAVKNEKNKRKAKAAQTRRMIEDRLEERRLREMTQDFDFDL